MKLKVGDKAIGLAGGADWEGIVFTVIGCESNGYTVIGGKYTRDNVGHMSEYENGRWWRKVDPDYTKRIRACIAKRKQNDV